MRAGKRRRRWTAEEEARLRSLWVPGATYREIGGKLGRSAAAVQVKGSKLRLERRERHDGWADEEKARLRALREAGRSMAEVAAALGRPETTVKDRARRLGLSKRRPGGWTAADDAELLVLVMKECSMREVAGSLERPVAEVRSRAAQLCFRKGTPAPAREARRAPGPARSCQYIGTAGSDPQQWSFCGADTVAGLSYCAVHAAVCYLQPGEKAFPENDVGRGTPGVPDGTNRA